MLSRRDLIHSRQYLRQRQVCALVSHRPDPLDWAGRNATTALFAGLMILVIALAGTAVYGKIFPGGSRAWDNCKSVIVERETGTTYICGLMPGVLNPTLNFTSAALILGTTKQVVASRSSLTWTRGDPVGIPDAPDNLPEPKRLLGGDWSLCSVIRPDQSGTGRPTTVVLVGQRPAGGRSLADKALVVAAPDGTTLVVWRGTRYPIADPQYVLPRLGLAPQQHSAVGTPVGAAWLAPLPLGATLGPIDVAGAGGAVPGLTQLKAGQFARVTTADGASRFYLAQRTGLQEVTEVQKSLVRTTANREPVVLTPADLAAPKVAVLPPMGWTGVAPPTRLPSFDAPDGPDGSACVVLNGTTSSTVLDGVLPATAATARPAPPTPGRAPAADAVLVPATYAALVTALASDTAPGGAMILVTDLGIRYALASPQLARTLGLPAAAAVPVPASLLELLPEGPGFDAVAARKIWAPRPTN